MVLTDRKSSMFVTLAVSGILAYWVLQIAGHLLGVHSRQ